MQNNIVIVSYVIEIGTHQIHLTNYYYYNNNYYPTYYCVQYDSCIRINNFSQCIHYTQYTCTFTVLTL